MRILVLCPPQSPIFEPIARAIFLSFLEMGHDAQLSQEYVSGYDICLCVSFYHPWQLPRDKTLKIGYHMEPIPWKWRVEAEIKKWARNFQRHYGIYDKILDVSCHNVETLRQRGYKNIFWCALGYHPSFEILPWDVQQDEISHNVIFIGASTRRRMNIINRLRQQVPIEWIMNKYNFDDLQSLFWNMPIHLNIHISAQRNFEFARLITLLLANRQFVITEPTDDIIPFKNEQHLIVAKWEEFASKVRYFLKHPEERQCIAERGYKFIKQYYNFKTHLQRLLKEVLR